jgi:cyclophilin family peptidyl-prolyl cis-trans isomerase
VANRTATIVTDKGTIKFTLHEDKAPITTANFVKLAQSNFYDGLNFHRVEPGFVIQGGCPNGTGTGSSGTKIPLEIHKDLRHDRAGSVAMARSSDPNSASCQFYITLDATKFLDDNYAVFGHVTEGQDVVSQIRKGDKIQSVTIE